MDDAVTEDDVIDRVATNDAAPAAGRGLSSRMVPGPGTRKGRMS